MIIAQKKISVSNTDQEGKLWKKPQLYVYDNFFSKCNVWMKQSFVT